MRSFILLLFVLSIAHYCHAQRSKPIDTLATNFPNNNRVSGDTVFFKHPLGLTRFFNRNIRMEYNREEYELGYCSLYFVVDTSGTISVSWCEDVTNETVAREALRVTNRVTGLSPTYINGKPVITKVKTTIAFVFHDNVSENDKKADILALGYPPVH